MGDVYGYRDFLGAGTWTLPPAPDPKFDRMATAFVAINGLNKSYGSPQEIFSAFNWDLNFPKNIWGEDKAPSGAEFEEAWVSFNIHLTKTTLWAGSIAALKLCFLYSYASHYGNTYLGHMDKAVVVSVLDSELAEYKVVDKVRTVIVDSESYKNSDLKAIAKKVIAMFKNLGVHIERTQETVDNAPF